VIKDGKKEEIQPELVYKKGMVTSAPVEAFSQYEIMINGVNPRDGTISIDFTDRATNSKSDSIEVEISYKPLINLVWLGAILITLGCGWGASNRFRALSEITDNKKQKGSMSYN
jgi:cytochrome c-type biogenesis protein CcmF